ncbi:odv-e25 [Hyphantria cunea granulovirus]|uniref:Odv-e25 n=1 Tax=Hyphantria cunea granulovirus TaxID=307448 RepID=A0AAF1D293_9BBAC|nr:odv-e25 [Hyphantria cunea granulovirus]QBQ01633.1 odv-e25 [Hyphantria cunea granulovirus]
MWGLIVLLLVIGAVLYLLFVNDKLNANSLNDSMATSNRSSGDSLNFTPDGEARLRLNPARFKHIRLTHGDSDVSKIVVTENVINHNALIEQGDNVAPNTVILGALEPLNGMPVSSQQTSNFVIKNFKNMFIVFKGLSFSEIDSNNIMVRFEANKMVYALVDASNSTLPELLKDVQYPIVVLTNNSSAQLVLKEWGFTQINNAATLFVKNEKSFRFY